jgi:hypothetical protein
MDRRGAAVAAISMAAALALGGCADAGSDGGDDPSGAETSSGATTETPAGTPTETATDETPTPEPTPTVEPASGPRLDVSGVRVNAPKGWKQTISSVVVDTALGRVDGYSGAVVLSAAATGGEQLSARQAERYFWSGRPEGYQRQDPVVVGDVTAGYYTARDRFDDFHAVTLWDDNHVIKVEVSFGRQVADDRQDELFRSVLASYSVPRMR